MGGDEDVVNDVHNTAGIDVSGGYFGVVDVDCFFAFNSLDLLVVLGVLGVHGTGSNEKIYVGVGEHIVESLMFLGSTR